MTINTSITFKKDSKGKITRAIITGATAYYVKLQKPSPIFEQRDMGANATKTEWTTDLVVSEDTADEFDSVFNKQSSKKVSKADFMKRFKIEDENDLPDPKAKKFFVIKVKHAAQDKDGNPINEKLRPRAVEVIDGKPVDITFDKLVGNGSKVDVLLRVSENSFGTFAYYSVLKVTDLVEYEGAGGKDEVEDDFLGGSLDRAEDTQSQGTGQAAPDDDEGFSDGTDEAPDFDESDDMY